MASGIVSVEFFVLFMILISIFIFSIIVANGMQTTSSGMAARERASAAAGKIAAAANAVLLAGNGSNISVTIPTGYNISYSPRAVMAIDNESRGGSAALITDHVNISVSSGAQVIAVWNFNGEVRISG